MTSTLRVTNPATGALIKELPIHDAATVKAEMQRVRAAAGAWADLPVRERCRRLRPVQDVIRRRMLEIARLVSEENGKVLPEALLHDVGPALLVFSYFIERAPKILAPETIHTPLFKHRKSVLTYQPKGVIAVISPWNFPFFIPASDVTMSLIAGNGVLLKPSEITPLSGLMLKECFDEGGLDPNLFRVVTGLGPTGAAVIDAEPDHVVFTGSVPTGRKIGIACAERMIGYTLELGGKAPAVVLEDADLERAANAIVWGGFSNAGQICASVERVYAIDRVYDTLVQKVADRAGRLRVGPAGEGAAVDVGAITLPRQVEVAERLIADAKKKGARVLTGGEPIKSETGRFFPPTVIADCDHTMDVMTTEIFGPIVPMMKVADEREAIRLSNDSKLGLGAYVFTGDVERGHRIAEKIEVGSVMINDVLTHAGSPEMPWSGIKQSGLGVARSDRGLRELCHTRHINEPRIPIRYAREPYWFPYPRSAAATIEKLLEHITDDGIGGRIVRLLMR